MTQNLGHYNELLQKARTANDEARSKVAKEYVPQLYEELKNQGFSPFLARTKIVEDCVPMWTEETTAIHLSKTIKCIKNYTRRHAAPPRFRTHFEYPQPSASP